MFGEHFGYPKCCIDAMVKKNQIEVKDTEGMTDDQKRKYYAEKRKTANKYNCKWGFRPCDSCLEKVGDRDYATLLVNRECKLSPDEAYMADTQRDAYRSRMVKRLFNDIEKLKRENAALKKENTELKRKNKELQKDNQ